jgi:hypothetical protein
VAETANLAKMAEFLANKVFSVFGWKTTGSTNQNWPCERQVEHKRLTHPSDVVFFYGASGYLVGTGFISSPPQ